MQQQIKVIVYRRHADGCNYSSDRFSQKCSCGLWLQWQDRPGHQTKKSAKTHDWAEAHKLAHIIEKSGRAPETEPVKTTYLLKDAVDRYITWSIQQGHADGTLVNAESLLWRMVAFCAMRKVTTIDQVTPLLLSDFRNTWNLKRNSDGKPASNVWNVYGKRIRAFFNWAVKLGLINFDPSKAGLERMKVESVQPLPFTPDEVEKLLATIPKMDGWSDLKKQQIRCCILVGRFAGLAAVDAVMLRKDALTDDDEIVIARMKTDVDLTVPVPPFVAKALRELTQDDHVKSGYFMFRGQKPNAMRQWYTDAFGELMETAGVSRNGHHTITHRLRDCYAVQLILAGVDIESVSRALGHSSIIITERSYAPWIRERQKKLSEKLRAAWAAQGIG